MDYKRILTIQDISCVGQCSLTVALPIISACGQETCILPSAVLSTHTMGFSFPTVRDLTEDIPAIEAHWQKENVKFDAIYTGYLGSTKQIDYVEALFQNVLAPGGKIIVDPAMADNGKLYPAFDMEYVAAMRRLVARAQVVIPNLTEACFLTDTPYRDTYDRAFIMELTEKLHAMGAKCVVFTGVGFEPDMTGVLTSDETGVDHYSHPRIPQSFHGTGDVYASAFVGSWLSGKTLNQAVRIAADFTCQAMKNTIGDDSHWYGVKFETALGYLIQRIAE